MAAGLKLVCALVLCMLVVEPLATSAIMSCRDVASKLSSCIKYLQNGGSLPPSCCVGIRTLDAQVRTSVDRQTTCRCLQNAAMSISGIKLNLAEGLPGTCGVNIPYKISPSTNCDSVK